ncbi:esterase/lipase family protein [Leucobacter albus]|uniref:Esterase/lipase family protein n=1 Tax=Leucobacter albus TaxID=272210 RepID=A0ABW3TRC2_9MICO
MKRIRQLWWRVCDYAYAGVWQLRATLTRLRPESLLAGELRPVLVLPGVYEPWAFMLPLMRELHRAGHPVHVVTALGRNRRPVEDAARAVGDYLARAGLTDVVIVAHSKGGLIGKQVMAFGASAPRIRAMLAIATPFAGSRYASFMLNRTLRAFSPRNAALVALGRSQAVNSRIVSLFPAFDPHIPEGSELAGAANVRVPTPGHFRVLGDERARAVALRVAAGELPPFAG